MVPHSFNDSPTGTAYVIFFNGCNVRCPYCHNASFARGEAQTNYQVKDIEKELEGLWQKGPKGNEFRLVDWLILSGGEPLLTK